MISVKEAYSRGDERYTPHDVIRITSITVGVIFSVLFLAALFSLTTVGSLYRICITGILRVRNVLLDLYLSVSVLEL